MLCHIKQNSVTIILLAVIFTCSLYMGIQQMNKQRQYQLNLHEQNIRNQFEWVSMNMYLSHFNISKIKEFNEFKAYVASDAIDYYNLTLLCERMTRDIFKNIDGSARIGFFYPANDHVIFGNETQSGTYFFSSLKLDQELLPPPNQSAFLEVNDHLYYIKCETVGGKAVYWIIVNKISHLFSGLLEPEYQWEFYDKNNRLIYANTPAGQALPEQHATLFDFYMGNYIYYAAHTGNNYIYLINSLLFACVISYFVVHNIKYLVRRNIKPIAAELNVPEDKNPADYIIREIQRIKYENSSLEDQYRLIRQSKSTDLLKDFFRGLRTWQEIKTDISETYLEKVTLLHIGITKADHVIWKEIEVFLTGNLKCTVYTMNINQIFLTVKKSDESSSLTVLKQYIKNFYIVHNVWLKLDIYEKSNYIYDFEAVYYEFTEEVPDKPEPVKESHDLGHEMIEFIRQNYYRDISLYDLADHLGKSHKYASTTFKNHTGSNFKEYLTRYRMEKARQILHEQQNIKIKNLAQELGYNSSNSFIRVFKNYFGVSPKGFSAD